MEKGKFLEEYMPTKRTKMSWDIFICFVYLNSLFEDSFYFSTDLYPLIVPFYKATQTFFSMCMVIDIILTFMTAIKKELKIEFEEEELK